MRESIEHTLTSFDGQSIFFRHWPATTSNPTQGNSPRKAFILMHRGHEHSGRLQHIVDELGYEDYDFFAWDARGHGLSEGERGYCPNVVTACRDLQSFVDHLQGDFAVNLNQSFIIAQSVGAVIAATWLHDYAPKVKGAILASPAFKVKLYVPLAIPGLSLMQKIRGHFYVNSYVKGKWLTHDPERVASYNHDKLITRPISVDMLLDLFKTSKRIVADSQAIHTPIQLLISGDDWVVHHKPQHQFYDRLSSTIKEKHILNGFYHDTLGEKDRELAFDKIRAFVDRCHDYTHNPAPLRQADRYGYSYEECQQLNQTLSKLSLEHWYWAATKSALRLGGKLSKGVALGHEIGFDSGSMLDYVYQNKPSAATQTPVLSQLGRCIDKQYLNAIGWRGIRQRKVHLENLIDQAIQRLTKAKKPIHIVDIAAGHGRYLLDALNKRPDSIVLRDYSDTNVQEGKKLLKSRHLDEVGQFIKADAFNTKELSQTLPHPTLAISSGLYELFPDNALINASLDGLSQAMKPGSYFIYTNQPWHPQLAFIARALTSHREHEAWVMRRRSQAEMDQLVDDAGFEKLTQLIDQWGIFTVTLAVKR